MSGISRFPASSSYRFLSSGHAPSTPKAVIDRYCVGCHSGWRQIGRTFVQSLNPEEPAPAAEVGKRWCDRCACATCPLRVCHGPMSGPYMPSSPSSNRNSNGPRLLKPNPGRTDTFQRLNRTEYRNAVRDLLGD